MQLSDVLEQIRTQRDANPPEVSSVIEWISRAAALPGKSPVKLAVHLAQQAVKLQRLKAIGLRREPLERFGLSRSAAHEAIVALENAGLIKSYRLKGRRAVAEILLDEATPAEAHRDLAS